MIMLNPDRSPHLPARVDLRRRPNLSLSQWLLTIAPYLDHEEQALIEAIFGVGATLSTVARLTGRSRHAVGRRLRHITQRATDPRFAWTVACLPEWPELRAHVARQVIIQGRTIRDAADHLNVTQHAVRNEMATINALFRSQQEGGAK